MTARYLVPLAITLLAACSDATGPDLSVAQKPGTPATQLTGPAQPHTNPRK